eukprot:m.25043 g.25043  ORF g.25043 m.25043 type:complete len:210 (-) comp5725_c0_seq1:1150-1779(-)
MSGYETSPLTGHELFPKRVGGGSMQTVEKVLFYGALVFGFAVACVCIAFGALYHVQHLIIGIAILLVGGLFYLLLRGYLKDTFQDRKIVFYACFCLYFISVSGLLYSIQWQKTPDAFHGCTGWYLPSGNGGQCATTFPTSVKTYERCYFFRNATVATPMIATILNGLPGVNKSSIPTCQIARTWVSQCTGFDPTWTCTKEEEDVPRLGP